MSLDLKRQAERPITRLDELLEYFQGAERPREQHKVGLEHEKFVYPMDGARAVPYDGAAGIRALLDALEPHGYQAFRESPQSPVIALQKGEASISLEPGGQLELSGTAFKTAREAHRENEAHLAEVKAAASRLGLGLVALGYRPFDRVPEMPWMPKTRYRTMRETLGARGTLALDMMLMTATGQVSLDWESEADCARKVTLTSRLTPLLVALYANSPLKDGKPSGFMSYRSNVWTDVDNARCGYQGFMLDGSFSYRAYAEWALDAPMLFLRRDGQYLTPKRTFRQHLKDGFEGKPADYADWVDHLSTMFPEVRIKKVMEVRGADCVPAAQTGALVALWRGLLYDPQAMDEAEKLLPRYPLARQLEFQEVARRDGLRGRFDGRELAPLARDMVAIARRGLERLDPQDAPLLDVLAELAESGRSLADRVLEQWTRDPDPARLMASCAL